MYIRKPNHNNDHFLDSTSIGSPDTPATSNTSGAVTGSVVGVLLMLVAAGVTLGIVAAVILWWKKKKRMQIYNRNVLSM